MKHIASVDVGGTNIVCGILGEYGDVKIKRKIPTNPERGSTLIVNEIASTIKSLSSELGISFDDIIVIGLGIPGLIDSENGICLKSVNLNWVDYPIASELETILRKPVYVDNDVRMYVFGEATAGAGTGFQYVYGLTIGTGLAAAFVDNGRLYTGSKSLAGEIGHVAIDGYDFKCKCGLTGCLETIVSATGIVSQAKKKVATGQSSILQGCFPDLDFTSADVSKAALENDQLAIEVMNDTGRALGMALSWVVSITSPDVIIIGGGGSAAGNLILKPMHEEMHKRLLKDYFGNFTIKIAELGDDAGLIGSAMYALSRCNREDLVRI